MELASYHRRRQRDDGRIQRREEDRESDGGDRDPATRRQPLLTLIIYPLRWCRRLAMHAISPLPDSEPALYRSGSVFYYIISTSKLNWIYRIYNQNGGTSRPMPRTYRLGLREEASEQTRSRILAAARDLLIATDGFSSFSMEAVARRADVARMTVYHQFGSKIGLLEAICDTLAASGGMEQMASAFSRPDPLDALEEFIAVFG